MKVCSGVICHAPDYPQRNCPYENWLRWNQNARLHHHRRYDLLSEYVNPKEEQHMVLSENCKEEEYDRKPAPVISDKDSYNVTKYDNAENLVNRPFPFDRANCHTLSNNHSTQARLASDSVEGIATRTHVVARKPTLSSSSTDRNKFGATERMVSLRMSSSIVQQQLDILKQIQRDRMIEHEQRLSYVALGNQHDNNLANPQHEWSNTSKRSLTDSTATALTQIDGFRLKILPENRVHDAINRGEQVVTIKCIGCSKKLLATCESPVIYCPVCFTLSSVEVATYSGSCGVLGD